MLRSQYESLLPERLDAIVREIKDANDNGPWGALGISITAGGAGGDAVKALARAIGIQDELLMLNDEQVAQLLEHAARTPAGAQWNDLEKMVQGLIQNLSRQALDALGPPG